MVAFGLGWGQLGWPAQILSLHDNILTVGICSTLIMFTRRGFGGGWFAWRHDSWPLSVKSRSPCPLLFSTELNRGVPILPSRLCWGQRQIKRQLPHSLKIFPGGTGSLRVASRAGCLSGAVVAPLAALFCV